MLTSLISRTIS